MKDDEIRNELSLRLLSRLSHVKLDDILHFAKSYDDILIKNKNDVELYHFDCCHLADNYKEIMKRIGYDGSIENFLLKDVISWNFIFDEERDYAKFEIVIRDFLPCSIDNVSAPNETYKETWVLVDHNLACVYKWNGEPNKLYLFRAPNDVTISEGDLVLCKTRKLFPSYGRVVTVAHDIDPNSKEADFIKICCGIKEAHVKQPLAKIINVATWSPELNYGDHE